MTDIGQSADFSMNYASAISDRGEIVGHAWSLQTGNFEAVRFTRPGIVRLADEVEDIGDWWLEFAYSVNNRGEIVGHGIRADGLHSFKLVPIGASRESARSGP